MTTTAKTLFTVITAATISVAAFTTPSLAQGGGYQWNVSGPTAIASNVGASDAKLFAGHLNSYQSGESNGAIPAEFQLGEVVGMAASCLYLVQNGTWRAPNFSSVN